MKAYRWLTPFILFLTFQHYACDHQIQHIDESQKVFVEKKTVNTNSETSIALEKEFKASCTSTAGGCDRIQDLKQTISNYDDFFIKRASFLKQDLKNLIEALNKAQYVYPMFSVELKWIENPSLWESISGNKGAKVILKTKYNSWENAFYPQDTAEIKAAYTKFTNDLKFFEKELETVKTQSGFSFENLSLIASKLAEDVTFTVTDQSTQVYPIPKAVVSSFEYPKPHENNMIISIVNSEFDLNYHIVEEKILPVAIQPFLITDSTLLLKSALIEKKNITFKVPTEAICKSLRAEARIEKPNEEIRHVMKIIADPTSVLKDEEKITFASTQITNKLSLIQEEAKKLKSKNIMLEVAKLLTEPNSNLLAEPTKKDGVFDGWDFPSKNISPSDFQIVNLLRELKPQSPLEKKLCISVNNIQAFSLQTSEASLPMILDILNIPQNVLLPEETLSVTWNEKSNKNSMVGEKGDFGVALFETLKKKKEAVLKFNQPIKTIPYMIHLQTDTGSKINLPVEIDGLKSKQTLDSNTKWRLLGIAEQFEILADSVYHQKLLSKVIDEGSVKLFDIQYEKSFPEYLTDWNKIRQYEVHLNGDLESFLGITVVSQYFRQIVKKTENCDIDISFEFKNSRDVKVNDKVKENPSLVRKTILHIPNPKDQYVFGYADPPNCQ